MEVSIEDFEDDSDDVVLKNTSRITFVGRRTCCQVRAKNRLADPQRRIGRRATSTIHSIQHHDATSPVG